MSINTITFLKDVFKFNIFFIMVNPIIKILEISSIEEWRLLINELREGTVYTVTVELIIDSNFYDSINPTIVLIEPFLITKESDAITIADYIIASSINASIMFNLSDDKIPKFLVKYSKIYN